MKHLVSLNKYFWKYKWLFLLGIIFIILSNYFRILSPQVTKYVLNTVEHSLKNNNTALSTSAKANYDPLVKNLVINKLEAPEYTLKNKIFVCGIILLVLALISGFFMFLMRQTIIVMSRHIEYDQKNEIFSHYQELDTNFYKTHSTGDLMSRISEDVSRVRMYTGPAVMYIINLAATIGFSVFYMMKENKELTLYVLSPLPVLAFAIYYVNTIINRKSDRIQSLLSDLTTNAQESYSGIRVIKSFVQEKAMLGFFEKSSEDYRKNAISLAKTESIYFPSIALLVGLSTLVTILIGGLYVINGQITIGVIGEFVMYILLLSFPVSALGWTASMIQRAITSQRRINEFLHTKPTIQNTIEAHKKNLEGNIEFKNVDFIYPHTGIHAIKNFNLKIDKGEKIAIIGKTGSGKSTIAQLLLRMYDPQQGDILYDDTSIRKIDLKTLRSQISYVPQDVFLFSDTVENNISFSTTNAIHQSIVGAAANAVIQSEIEQFPETYKTMVGERGVTLSGGQKQRISIARALIKDHQIVIFDDCLSAVDAKTENQIISNLYSYLKSKTAIIITHRIFSLFSFDKIILLKEGAIAEEGTHNELMTKSGLYAEMYEHQQKREKQAAEQL
ncbi:MAG: ABC transporter ATP-binding protein/permease [Bacteroidota bacterium]|nr:ABC transporter ATP-binding protein/permease [Bacteroidota bacterium]